jgi:F-type H+-transporting ATPase subunit epsilon
MTAWRTLFTYVAIHYFWKSETYWLFRYNKYAQITARALRASLKEEERLVAEKRGLTSVRYQKWENGVGGQQVRRSFFFFD